MTERPAFEAVAEDAVTRLGPVAVRALADRIRAGWPDHATMQAVPVPGFAGLARELLQAQQAAGWSDLEAAAYLSGLAAGHIQRAASVQVESVWSGPSTYRVPVRATAQVLVDLVAEAQSELILMTYSATRYQPLVAALTAATGRGVTIDVVVETLAGAGTALSGSEPATAFVDVPEIRLWHWPVDQRDDPRAKLHAKIAVVDRRALLVSSANLTQSGVGRNIEAGLLVRGGSAPQRAAEHIHALQAQQVLVRLLPGQ